MSYGKGVGYSAKIDSPEFKKLRPKNLARLSVPALVLAPIAIAVFILLAAFSIISWSIGLIAAGICGLVFLGLYYVFTLGTKEVKSLDGVLAAKKRLRKKGSVDDDDIILLLVFKLKNGDERKVNVTDHKALFRYYQTGETVRFHPGLTYPEKKQKVFDDKVVCVSCGKLTDPLNDRCRNCRLPLLK